jgi:hypothetical protein
MLNRIRDFSSSPVILIMFGMLILVFVLFFGMPSLGGLGQDASLFSRPSAQIGDSNISLKEALLYARRRNTRRSDERVTLKIRYEELKDEALLDMSAKLMGWESKADENRRFIASSDNLDLIFFGEENRRREDLFKAYVGQLPKGVKVENMSAEELLSSFLAFAKKGRGFIGENFSNAMSSWGVNSDEYISSKGRELRLRGYLDFLQDQVKVSNAQLDDDLNLKNTKWVFNYVQIGTDHVNPSTEQFGDEAVKTFLKDNATEIEKYYNQHVEDYSKSKLKFTRVTARYSNAEQMQKVKEKIDQARDRIIKGEESSEVAKSLTSDGIFVSALAQANKTRKNTSKALFDQALSMELNQLSEVKLTESKNPQVKAGSYAFIRLEEKVEGEEKTLESVQSEIAKILLAQGAQKSMAKKQAEAILAKVKSSGDLNAEIIAYNATLNTASGVKSIELKETGAITLDGLLADNIEGLGRNAIAAFNLLNEINAIDMTNRVATVANIDDQWVALVLKEKITEDEANRSSARQKQYLSSLKQAKKEFFGDRWLRYALVGPLSYDVLTQFPSEILSTLTSDIGISYFGGKEGSVDQILKSSAYQDQIVESADVKAFFNN